MRGDINITVYNYCDADETYYPTRIRGVDWYGGQAVSVGDKGLRSADQYTIRIPDPPDAELKVYVDCKVYQRLSASERVRCWTLREGDRIVKGILYDKIQSPKEFIKFPECVTVLGVSDNRRGSPATRHFKVACG